MFEVNEAANIINQHVDPDAKIIFGTSIDPNLNDEVRITVIATGFSKEKDDMPNYFGAIKKQQPSYQPPSFKSDEREPISHSNYQQNTPSRYDQPNRNNQSNNQQSQPSKPVYDDQLDVPAFLRKKLNLRDEE
jgi:cell division protein FtsZ